MTFEEKNNNDLDNTWKDYSYGIKKFDEQSLFISSGALALSLTFFKDIIPLKEAHYICLYFFSTIGFSISIIIGFLSHIVSSNISKAIFDLVLERSEMDENNKVEINKINSKIYNCQNKKYVRNMNKITTSALIIGLILLVAYCIINITIYRDSFRPCHCHKDYVYLHSNN